MDAIKNIRDGDHYADIYTSTGEFFRLFKMRIIFASTGEAAMRAMVLALGLIGLILNTASAADRWPAGPCRDVQAELNAANKMYEQYLSGKKLHEQTATRILDQRATQRMHLLFLLENHCDVDVSKAIQYDQGVRKRILAIEEQRVRRLNSKSKPLDCVTIGLSGNLATTHCD